MRTWLSIKTFSQFSHFTWKIFQYLAVGIKQIGQAQWSIKTQLKTNKNMKTNKTRKHVTRRGCKSSNDAKMQWQTASRKLKQRTLDSKRTRTNIGYQEQIYTNWTEKWKQYKFQTFGQKRAGSYIWKC